MLGYQLETDGKLFAQIKTKFADRIELIDNADWAANQHDKAPIFIVDMPRSGTALVGQIVSSHSLIHGADELALLDQGLEHLNAMSSELSNQNMRDL